MSKPITLLHLADTHFGMENYGTVDAQTGLHGRLIDFSRTLNQIVDYAIERSVDVVVFAGDAYKRNSPSPTEQREYIKPFLRLAEAGIPTVMISGNHDIPVMHGKASSIDIFRTLRPGMFYVYVNQPTIGNTPPPVIETRHGAIAFCCLPYISPSFLLNASQFRNLKGENLRDAYEDFFNQVITAMAQSVPEEIPRVLVAHLTVKGSLAGGYRGVSIASDTVEVLPANLAYAGYDYVALGHIHQHQDLSPRPEVPVVYSGSPDRIDFGERDEEKGFVIAQVERGKTTHEFIPTNVREFIQIDVETRPEESLTDQIVQAIQCEPIEDAVVRVRFTANDEEVSALDMKAIHQALRSAHFKAGLIRQPREQKNTRRSTSLSTEMTVQDALTAYLKERPDFEPYQESIIVKAKEIEDTVRNTGHPFGGA